MQTSPFLHLRTSMYAPARKQLYTNKQKHKPTLTNTKYTDTHTFTQTKTHRHSHTKKKPTSIRTHIRANERTRGPTLKLEKNIH